MSKSRNIADLGSNDVLETTSTGVDVTGTISADALDIAGAITADGLTVDGDTVLQKDMSSGNSLVLNDTRTGYGDWSFFKKGSNDLTIGYDTVGGASPTKALTIEYGGDIQFYEDTGTTPKLTWDASAESLGIGITTPNGKLDVYDSQGSLGSTKETTARFYRGDGTYNPRLEIKHNTSGTTLNHTYSSGASNLMFEMANTERMRIDSSGNLLVGTTGAGGVNGWTLYPTGSGSAPLQVFNKSYASFSNAITFQYSGSTVGYIRYNSTSTDYITSSDYRLKENVTEITDASSRILALKPCRFNFITEPSRTVDGFLAHEAQEVVPEAVSGTKDAMRTEEYEVTPAVLDDDGNVIEEAVMGTREVPDYQGIDQSKLVPLLTAALQEALTEIDSLKQRVDALENN
jgi:hypothetical protein